MKQDKSDGVGPVGISEIDAIGKSALDSAESFATVASATPKSFKSAFEGMKESQVKYYDTHDRGTDFLEEALKQAESKAERDSIRRDFMSREKAKDKVAEGNLRLWHYALGAVVVVGVAVVTRSVSATVATAKKVLPG